MGTLTWVDPTLRADSTATTPDLIAPDTFVVKIYDSASAMAGIPIGTVAQGVQKFTVPPLSPGVHVFTVTATDSEGDVSVPSGSVTVTSTLAAPEAPTNLTWTP
jgi:hypothetical protein